MHTAAALIGGDQLFIDGATLRQLILPPAAALIRGCVFLFSLPFLRSNTKTAAIFAVSGGLVCALPAPAMFAPLALFPPQTEAPSLLIASALAAEGVAGWLIALPFAVVAHRLVILLRLADLLRGAQEAEQAIPGLADRGSLLERGAWLAAGAIIFVSGSYRPALRLWFESFDRLPPLFFLAPQRFGEEFEILAQSLGGHACSLALQSVLSSITFFAPLIAAAAAIDLIRLISARMTNSPALAAEWQGLKLAVVLLLSAALIDSRCGAIADEFAQGAASVQTPRMH